MSLSGSRMPTSPSLPSSSPRLHRQPWKMGDCLRSPTPMTSPCFTILSQTWLALARGWGASGGASSSSVYHRTPGPTRLVAQLTEEEVIRRAQRTGLRQHLPKEGNDPAGDGSGKTTPGCAICMMEVVYGAPMPFLPFMHICHRAG